MQLFNLQHSKHPRRHPINPPNPDSSPHQLTAAAAPACRHPPSCWVRSAAPAWRPAGRHRRRGRFRAPAGRRPQTPRGAPRQAACAWMVGCVRVCVVVDVGGMWGVVWRCPQESVRRSWTVVAKDCSTPPHFNPTHIAHPNQTQPKAKRTSCAPHQSPAQRPLGAGSARSQPAAAAAPPAAPAAPPAAAPRRPRTAAPPARAPARGSGASGRGCCGRCRPQPGRLPRRWGRAGRMPETCGGRLMRRRGCLRCWCCRRARALMQKMAGCWLRRCGGWVGARAPACREQQQRRRPGRAGGPLRLRQRAAWPPADRSSALHAVGGKDWGAGQRELTRQRERARWVPAAAARCR